MAKKGSIATIPNYTFEPTTNPNIQRVCDMNGDWTHYYLVKEKRYVKAVNHVLELGHAKGPNFKAYLMRSSAEDVQKKLEEKGDEGSRTHQAIRELIGGSKVTMTTKYPSELHDGRQTILNMDEWENLTGLMNWCNKYQPRVVVCEETMTDGQTAGTIDAVMVITIPAGDKEFEKEYWGRDVLILIDWKTSASVWFEYEAQTAAYFRFLTKNKEYAKFLKAYNGSIFTGVVRIGTRHKSKYEFTYWSQEMTEGEHLTRYMAAQIVADRYESQEYVPVIEEIPTQYFIKMPKATVGGKKKKSALKNK